jgi:hypothetical protein
MRSISAHLEHGKALFAVRYSDYLTIVAGEVTNAKRLHDAVAAEAGARLSEPKMVRLGSATGLGEDEQWEWECFLEVNPANVNALLATDFNWEPSAIELARQFCPAETIQRICQAQEERNRKAKELLAQAMERVATIQQPKERPVATGAEESRARVKESMDPGAGFDSLDDRSVPPMNLDPKIRRLFLSFATAALVIAIVALWVPTSWQSLANQKGEHAGHNAMLTHIELGVLRPLRLSWESSPSGYWLGFTAVRVFPLFLTVTLTAAAAIVAWRINRLSRRAQQTNG